MDKRLKDVSLNYGLGVGETVYGTRKKLLFILKAINTHAKRRGMKMEDCEILDIGCGTGFNITIPIASMGYGILGIDSDRGTIDFARKTNSFDNLSFECETIEGIDRVFDVIVCSEILEHVEHPEDFLLQVGKRLKVGGIIIVTVPNGFGWFELEKLIYNIGIKYFISALSKLKMLKLPPADLVPNTLKERDAHLHHFTIKKLGEIFRESGFEMVKAKSSTLFSGPVTNSFFWGSKRFMSWNNKIIERLDLRFASGWYFILRSFKDAEHGC